jgi:CCR4-NOT transcription complex subunit 7/8
MTSGLVLTDKVSWICFHGAYDFAYILRLLTGKDKLPDNEKTFFEMLSIYFPKIVDIKYLMTLHKDLSKGGGLDTLGNFFFFYGYYFLLVV